jgi:hypothetical protein
VGYVPVAELLLEVRYGLGRDAVLDPALSYWEHGPGLRAQWQPFVSLRLIAGADLRWRAYDAFDEDLEVERRETYLEGGLRAEVDLANAWTLYGSVWASGQVSNAPELSYSRWVGSFGVAFLQGFF